MKFQKLLIILAYVVLQTTAIPLYNATHFNSPPPLGPYVKFFLYTRQSSENYEEIIYEDTSSIKKSHFNSGLPTTVVIHGYNSNIMSDLNQYIKNALLQREEHNVICVDWSRLAETIIYTDAAADTKPVGEYVGTFLGWMIGQGLKVSDLHVIGHSLGAHVAGFTGATLKPSQVIPRITGLDPAKPAFENAGPEDRLDSSDAEFVDCIHTCAGVLGMGKPICSADYYANGGEIQPGCSAIDFGACNHQRSYLYYAESIQLVGHKFKALQCTQVPIEGPGKICIPSLALMGDPAESSYTGFFYVSTNDKYPFAQNNV